MSQRGNVSAHSGKAVSSLMAETESTTFWNVPNTLTVVRFVLSILVFALIANAFYFLALASPPPRNVVVTMSRNKGRGASEGRGSCVCVPTPLLFRALLPFSRSCVAFRV